MNAALIIFGILVWLAAGLLVARMCGMNRYEDED